MFLSYVERREKLFQLYRRLIKAKEFGIQSPPSA